MSYKIGQIRKSNLVNELSTVLSLTSTSLLCPNNFGGDRNPFQDYGLIPSENFKKGETYYFRFAIAKIFGEYYKKYIHNSNLNIPDADIMNITLYLKNKNSENETEDPPQQIGTITVLNKSITFNQGFNNLNNQLEYQTESFVFTPDKDYDILIFRIQRNAYDVLESINHQVGNLRYDGRRWLLNDGIDTASEDNGERFLVISNELTCSVNSSFSSPTVLASPIGDYQYGCAQLHNIKTQQQPWLKLGYQCRPGSLIIVNKEPIRVGSSGIYELNNGIEITSVMIPVLGSTTGIDAFLLDYAYEEKD